MPIKFSDKEFQKIKNYLVLYNCALINMETRVSILLEDFKNFQESNPVEHVKSRLKSPESIAEKLHRRGFEISADSAIQNLFDIAGIRITCAYSKDISLLADIFRRQQDATILYERDYISKPKATGYRSHHIVTEVPIYLTSETKFIPVEIQIRTQAMDFWASLEHNVRYKYDNEVPDSVSAELVACAEEIAALDSRMYVLHERMRKM